MAEIKKILVAVDFSERSVNSLDYAVSLARKYSASLLLLYVADSGGSPSALRIHPGLGETAAERLSRYCEKHFEEMLVDVDTTGVKMEKRMVQGRTDLEIVRIAAIEDFDFIVMATHGYVGLDHLIKGSVAEKVVRTAPCPVLVVKALDYRFRLPGKTKVIRKEDLEKS